MSVAEDVRSWLDENWDPDRPLGEWWAMLAESGWGFPDYPEQWFGRGLPSDDAQAVTAAFRERGVYGPPHGIATMMVAPMLLELGTEEQKQRWLPGIVTGEDIWCQLFSEPGAGSDLAGLSTRAVKDGEQWIVNGQKVWTSGGHYAKRAILVARTDPGVPKHRGVSFFVIEMDQPGVEPRPLVQMTGDAEFNEVFLTDAVVPEDNLIGDMNNGWGVALRLLSYERESQDPDAVAGLQHDLDHTTRVGSLASGEVDDGTEGYMPTATEAWRLLVELIGERGVASDPMVRQRAGAVGSRIQFAKYAAWRAAAAAAAGHLPGPEVSLGKLRGVQFMREWRELALDVLGPHGQLAGSDAPHVGLVTQIALSIPGMSIAGGTDEIQRNIFGERVLGLPGEPRVDKDLPFTDAPR
ncbi:MAG: acyl-CoA dehydrogenase family protein [Actinomycetota bacterium]|nr:acyl-CoA dehydrogenase family protein [Actinomycetota bacterium]